MLERIYEMVRIVDFSIVDCEKGEERRPRAESYIPGFKLG